MEIEVNRRSFVLESVCDGQLFEITGVPARKIARVERCTCVGEVGDALAIRRQTDAVAVAAGINFQIFHGGHAGRIEFVSDQPVDVAVIGHHVPAIGVGDDVVSALIGILVAADEECAVRIDPQPRTQKLLALISFGGACVEDDETVAWDFSCFFERNV